MALSNSGESLSVLNAFHIFYSSVHTAMTVFDIEIIFFSMHYNISELYSYLLMLLFKM